jgi:hypothetical protein
MTEKNSAFQRNASGKGGIDWYRYLTTILLSILIPFVIEDVETAADLDSEVSWRRSKCNARAGIYGHAEPVISKINRLNSKLFVRIH